MSGTQILLPTIHWTVRSTTTGATVTVVAPSRTAALIKASRRFDDGAGPFEVTSDSSESL
jgi:hypothetical protein